MGSYSGVLYGFTGPYAAVDGVVQGFAYLGFPETPESVSNLIYVMLSGRWACHTGCCKVKGFSCRGCNACCMLCYTIITIYCMNKRCIHMYMYIHICIYICMCVYIYIYTC